jgi:hypothetical protein
MDPPGRLSGHEEVPDRRLARLVDEDSPVLIVEGPIDEERPLRDVYRATESAFSGIPSRGSLR